MKARTVRAEPIVGKYPYARLDGPDPAQPVHCRHSFGLEQFCVHLRDQPALSVLDLGEVNQENVSFLTSLGHRLYAEDFLRTVEAQLSGPPGNAGPSPAAIERIFNEALLYLPASFDAALLWDTLEQLPPALLPRTIERVVEVLRPNAPLLAFFHAEDKPEQETYSYRIVDDRNLRLHLKGRHRLMQHFNNRSIEKLFQPFHSIKFFLTRDHLREVIAIR